LPGQVLEYLGLFCGRESIDLLQNLCELGTHDAASLLGYSYFSVVLGFGEVIDQLPISRLPDLLVFIQKLQEKPITEQWAGALMSESSLQKDWLLPEEDEVWQNL
jgi:hypothetical protein